MRRLTWAVNLLSLSFFILFFLEAFQLSTAKGETAGQCDVMVKTAAEMPTGRAA